MLLTGHHSEDIQLTGTHCPGVHTWMCKVQGNGKKSCNWRVSPLKLPSPGQAGFADGWLSQRSLQVREEDVELLIFAFFKFKF